MLIQNAIWRKLTKFVLVWRLSTVDRGSEGGMSRNSSAGRHCVVSLVSPLSRTLSRVTLPVTGVTSTVEVTPYQNLHHALSSATCYQGNWGFTTIKVFCKQNMTFNF